MLPVFAPTITVHEYWSVQSHFREQDLIVVQTRKSINKAAEFRNSLTPQQHVREARSDRFPGKEQRE
jgi:hypothetical protein